MRNTCSVSGSERSARRKGRSARLAIALLLGLGAGFGCEITGIDGPDAVKLDATVKYDIGIASVGATPEPFDLHVMLRVPSGWSDIQASYTGTVLGSPVSGTPAQSATDPSAFCDFAAFAGATPAGYQDVFFSESLAGALGTDQGTLSVDFKIVGATGSFDMLAATAFEDGVNGGCADIETHRVRVFGTVPASGPWALGGLALGLLAAGALATGRFAPNDSRR